MGTAGAFGFICDEKYYILYNHWDSSPENLGKIFLDFIKYVNSGDGWARLKKNCRQIEVVDPFSIPTADQKIKYQKYANLGVSKQTLDDWYCLLRNLQNGNYFYELYVGKVKHMVNSAEFLTDIWCEYGYVIDLDQLKAVFWKDGKKIAKSNLKTIRSLPFDYDITNFFGRTPKSIIFSK